MLLDVSGRESSPFELALDKYGLHGEKASGELLSFSDSNGSPQVRAQRGFQRVSFIRFVLPVKIVQSERNFVVYMVGLMTARVLHKQL